MSHWRSLISFLLCWALMVTGVLAAPQQTQPPAEQPTPTIKVDVSEVLVDFVVRDKKGKLIRDLKPEEIEIYEEGQKQPVGGLRMIEGKEAILANAEHVTLDPLRQLRLVSLVFESMDQEGSRIARDAANELVKRDVNPNVYYAVFRINPTLRTVQGFTRDKDSLKKAIVEATSGVQQGGGQKLERGGDQQAVPTTQTTKTVEAGPAAAAAGGDFAAQAMARAIERMENFLRDSTSNQQGNMTLTSLLALVKGQQGLAGRKTALLFCGGLYLDQNMLPFYETLLGEANRTNFTFYGLDAKGLTTAAQNAWGASELLDDVKRAQDATRREGGAVTARDMTATDTQLNAGLRNMQLNLVNLSAGTGGFAITDTNDFRQPMTRVIEDVWTYYEANFKPANQDMDGKYRKLEVRVTRPNTVVQGRIGYFALPNEFRDVMFPWEVPMLKSITQAQPPADLDYRTAAFRFGESQGLVKGVLNIELPHAGLSPVKNTAGTAYLAHFSLVALIKDAGGQVVRKFQRDIPFSFPADKLDAFKIGIFSYAEPFEIPAGGYTVETAMMDRTNSKVSVRKFPMSIPRTGADGPRLSSLAMIRRVDPTQTPDTGGDPFRVQNNKITPDLDAKVPAAPGANINIYCIVYGKKGGPKPELFLEFLQNGQSVGKLPAPLPDMDAKGQIPYIATIPAANFPQGQWEVKAMAVQGGQQSNLETVKFAIVAAGSGGN